MRRCGGRRIRIGKRLKVIELPLPAPVYFRGQRLPASYANFYIANGVVLVPVFNDPNDRIALNILADLFPDREVVGIACRDFIWGLGAIHCMTQQQPAEDEQPRREAPGPPTYCFDFIATNSATARSLIVSR